MASSEEVWNRFSFHPATEVTGPQHDQIRVLFGTLAQELLKFTPASREQSLALTSLQESMMWANAAIACNQEQS